MTNLRLELENERLNNETKRTLGIEVEFNRPTNLSKSETVEKLNETGITVVDASYGHSVNSNWKVVTDGSTDLELVSPILKLEELKAQLKALLEKMNEIGCSVDRRCGVHLHVGVSEFKKKNFINLLNIYKNSEKVMDSLQPRSRRNSNNTYCASLQRKNIEDLVGYSARSNVRYHKINFCCFATYGTVEFRHQAGTLNFEKIMLFVAITTAMTEKASCPPSKVHKFNSSKPYSMAKMFQVIRMSKRNPEMVNFAKARVSALA
tara:strand:+ start:1438 stop:2226 length:789 start_codon:yes stop_codon:yes gene_type:complete